MTPDELWYNSLTPEQQELLAPCGYCRRCELHDDPGGCLTSEANERELRAGTREVPHFVHRDSHGVWVMLTTDEVPWLVTGEQEWSPATFPVFRVVSPPRTLRDRDYYLSGEHSLGTPVLGPEDYWNRGYELLGEVGSGTAWRSNFVELLKATMRVGDDLRDAARALDSIKLERA